MIVPQLPAEQVGDEQVPQWPVWHDSPFGHVPQFKMLPQPSLTLPHSRFISAQVLAEQHLLLASQL
jgi:hypothetical protein